GCCPGERTGDRSQRAGPARIAGDPYRFARGCRVAPGALAAAGRRFTRRTAAPGPAACPAGSADLRQAEAEALRLAGAGRLVARLARRLSHPGTIIMVRSPDAAFQGRCAASRYTIQP